MTDFDKVKYQIWYIPRIQDELPVASFYNLDDAAIEYTEGQGFFRNIIPIDISKSKLILENHQISEIQGDMDLVFNPGETIALSAQLVVPPIFSSSDSIKELLFKISIFPRPMPFFGDNM